MVVSWWDLSLDTGVMLALLSGFADILNSTVTEHELRNFVISENCYQHKKRILNFLKEGSIAKGYNCAGVARPCEFFQS